MERPTSIFNTTKTTVAAPVANVIEGQIVGGDILNETSNPIATVSTQTKAIVIPAKSVNEATILKLGSTSGQSISVISGKILKLRLEKEVINIIVLNFIMRKRE